VGCGDGVVWYDVVNCTRIFLNLFDIAISLHCLRQTKLLVKKHIEGCSSGNTSNECNLTGLYVRPAQTQVLGLDSPSYIIASAAI
jgi:hypothetical protein